MAPRPALRSPGSPPPCGSGPLPTQPAAAFSRGDRKGARRALPMHPPPACSGGHRHPLLCPCPTAPWCSLPSQPRGGSFQGSAAWRTLLSLTQASSLWASESISPTLGYSPPRFNTSRVQAERAHRPGSLSRGLSSQLQGPQQGLSGLSRSGHPLAGSVLPLLPASGPSVWATDVPAFRGPACQEGGSAAPRQP